MRDWPKPPEQRPKSPNPLALLFSLSKEQRPKLSNGKTTRCRHSPPLHPKSPNSPPLRLLATSPTPPALQGSAALAPGGPEARGGVLARHPPTSADDSRPRRAPAFGTRARLPRRGRTRARQVTPLARSRSVGAAMDAGPRVLLRLYWSAPFLWTCLRGFRRDYSLFFWARLDCVWSS